MTKKQLHFNEIYELYTKSFFVTFGVDIFYYSYHFIFARDNNTNHYRSYRSSFVRFH